MGASYAEYACQHHSRETREVLDYVVEQTTELDAGRVVRQENVLDPAAR